MGGTQRQPRPYVCGIDAAIDVVGGKWKPLILWALADGTQRFGELRRMVPGVTEKMLTQHLRELEADELVHREVYREVPPKVEYSLTPLGIELNDALDPLGTWGRKHMDHIVAVRSVVATGSREASGSVPPRRAEPRELRS